MFKTGSSLQLPAPGERAGLGLVAGLAVLAVLGAVDAAAGADIIIVTAYVLGAFTTALIGTPREALAVTHVTTLLAVVSGTWNENFAELDHFVRIAIVAMGGLLAVVAAAGRVGEATVRERFRLLIAAARVVDEALTLEETVERLNGIIVPDFADVCVFDVVRDDRLERLSVRAAGPTADRIQGWLRERPPDRKSVV
jgi:hypothetical protein